MTVSQAQQQYNNGWSMYENNPGVYTPSVNPANPTRPTNPTTAIIPFGPYGPQQPGQNPGTDTFNRSNMSANEMVDKFYDATYRWGTDDDAFNEVCENINKDNVMEVMKAWNKYHSKEKGESFMEAFMWDADHDQKAEYGKQIELALRDRAEAAGVYDEEMAEAFAKIDNELRSTFINNDISEEFDAIIAKIAEAEADKAAENETDPDKKEEARQKALEFSEPYRASGDTKGWIETAAGDVAEFFDDALDFCLGWL